MTRLRVSIAPLFACAALLFCLPAAAEEKFPVNRAFDEEVAKTTEEVLKYTDANGDGVLNHPETKAARTRVAELMIDRLPRASYISGGEVTINRLRQRISQQAMDTNADGVVDATELGNFIGFAIAARERAVRTPYSAQWSLMREESKGEVMKYTWKHEEELRKITQWTWHRKAIQDRRQTWFDIQARMRALKMQADRVIAESRAKADREAILRENSPGLDAPEGTPAPINPAPVDPAPAELDP